MRKANRNSQGYSARDDISLGKIRAKNKDSCEKYIMVGGFINKIWNYQKITDSLISDLSKYTFPMISGYSLTEYENMRIIVVNVIVF